MTGPQTRRRSLVFGNFELETSKGELRQSGVRLSLQEQPLQILCSLLEHPGAIVTRDALRQKIWPADTFVDFDHGINNAIRRLREALGDTADAPRYIETVPKRGYRFVGKIERETAQAFSLLVLPLANLSRDPDQEYFAEGLTEALITTLARIRDLRVISRTTSMLYKKPSKPIREIARELEVDAVIEGTVSRDGSRVRITAQLVDVRQQEAHLWAECYERDLKDILALQAEVARAIASEVHRKLAPLGESQFGVPVVVNPEAYEAYLKGRYHWNRRSRESHSKAIQYFEQAIDIDPTYSPAYSGLADAVSIAALWGLLSPEDGCGRAKALALRALEQSPDLGEAHVSLGWASLHYDHNFAVAEREFRRGIELDPSCFTAHHWLGMSFGMIGRFEEAYAESKLAVHLDPHLSLVHFGLAFIYWGARRYDAAIEATRDALELEPGSPQAHVWLGVSYSASKAYQPAIAALEKAVDLSHRAPVALACLAAAYAADGNHDAAAAILTELESAPHVTAYFVARVYAALGERGKAIDWLELGQRNHAEWMVLIEADPIWDGMRDNPKFRDVVQHMGFPDWKRVAIAPPAERRL